MNGLPMGQVIRRYPAIGVIVIVGCGCTPNPWEELSGTYQLACTDTFTAPGAEDVHAS